MPHYTKRFVWLLLICLFASLLAGCGSQGFVVKPGNVGLVVNHYSGSIDSRVRHAGFNPQAPFSGNEIIEIPTYERTYTMVKDSVEGSHQGDDSVVVNTLSANILNVDASISYHIAYDPAHPETIVSLYRKYRTQFNDFDSFEEYQLRPAFRQSIVDAFGTKNTDDAMTGNGKLALAQYAKNQLNARFNPDSISVDEVRIRAVYPDANTTVALQTRLAAQQNLRLAQYNLELQQLVNQKNIMKAQADAEATHIRAASLTPRLVKYRHLNSIQLVGVPSGSIVSVKDDSEK